MYDSKKNKGAKSMVSLRIRDILVLFLGFIKGFIDVNFQVVLKEVLLD